MSFKAVWPAAFLLLTLQLLRLAVLMTAEEGKFYEEVTFVALKQVVHAMARAALLP